MNLKILILLLFFLPFFRGIAQNNSISIKASLNADKDLLKISQKIIFYNNSKDTLSELYLHNWSNSFKNKDTPLSKRFIEDYDKSFYFSKQKDKGYSIIHNLAINFKSSNFQEVTNHPDILKIKLQSPLLPKKSVIISIRYTQKIANAKFTGYGKTATGYDLRFWSITPAVYQNKWELMSNLNINDLFMEPSNYTIDFKVPKKYVLQSNLHQSENQDDDFKKYHLVGNQKTDIRINIDLKDKFKIFKTKYLNIKTNISTKKIDNWFILIISKKKRDTIKNINNKVIIHILNRELEFIKNYLGKYPNKEIFIDKNTVNKNAIYELFKIPKILKPFPDSFIWDIAFFKALSKKYVETTLFFNKRKDYWFSDGLQIFLLMEYLKKYYPKVKLLGKFSDYWPIRSFNISKLKFNDKYPLVYRFSAHQFLDQPLTTKADSLSNFNRKIISKYKAALGLKYLKDFLGDSVLKQSIKELYHQNKLKISHSDAFKKIITSKTTKNLNWFFGDYLTTNKKIDYSIKKVHIISKDSMAVTVKNNRNITTPVALYGVKNKKIKFKKWITGVKSEKTVTIYKGNFNKLALNYENLYPEYNLLNNWKKVQGGLLDKPFQLKFWKDIENPYYYQLYYLPNIKYNLYDGIILGVRFHNQSILTHNFEFSITPNYATKSQSITGGFSVLYNHFFKKTKIHKIQYGLSTSNYHYAKGLAYNLFYPYINIEFKRNSLRDVDSKFLLTRLIYVNKEVPFNKKKEDNDIYTILNFRYTNSKNNIIKNFKYALNVEISNNFSKLSTDIRYRKLTDTNHSFNVRFFGGVFLNNSSKGNYFSYGLNRGFDYLFEQNLFGRSEKSGLFSQQFIIADGGFKSIFKNKFANQFLFSVNSSVSIWRFIEFYNDFAMYKSRGQNINFAYENGIRLNFIPTIFEFYFPIYTNQGWEVNQSKYPTKIRFIITTNISKIYNFLRRGIL